MHLKLVREAIVANLLLLMFAWSSAGGAERERIELAAVPSVSPDGNQIAFAWRDDIRNSFVIGYFVIRS